MPLKDIYARLKTSIVGTKTSQIDAKLDKAVQDIISYKSQSGRNAHIDLIKNLIAKNGSLEINTSGSGLFNQGPTSPATFGQGSRLLRYTTYESIISNINYCYRALSVLTDNILAPDDITKISLEITPKSFLESEADTESKSKHVKEITERLKIEENLDLIVKNTLLFGDFFVEIADAKTALVSKAYLAEGYVIEPVDKELVHTKDMNVYMHWPFSEGKEEDKQKEGQMDVNDLKVVYHEPRRVVKLQSDVFPICFGYLIFPSTSLNPQRSFEDQSINGICMSILKSLEKKIPQTKELKNNDDLKDMIRTMIAEGDYSKEMSVRYVSPDRIQHFHVPSTKYYPYGESIFDSSQFTAKVLIALETALAIQRLSRSTEKRKVAIEIGLPRDARKVIERLKEDFNKRKISLDSFGTVDTIPSMITTFEDIYIPQKDGKPFVDISTFTEGNVDVRGKVDELKFIRDSVIANLGVPPSFLNIEENLSNKAALSEENILFARTIVAHQKYLSHQITDLIEKIYAIIEPEDALTLLDNVHIAFPPPKSLQFEREARYMNELASLVETLERIGVPKEWAKKKYLTGIDWDDLEKYETNEKIEKSLGTKKDEEGGMGGGYGGGF